MPSILKRIDLLTASFFGFSAVALGAFGAHGLAPRLEETGGTGWWETAALYHMVHAVVIFAIAIAARSGRAKVFSMAAFAIGIILFSGSLYAMALTGNRAFAPVTPFGGVLLLVGWGACAALRTQGSPEKSQR